MALQHSARGACQRPPHLGRAHARACTPMCSAAGRTSLPHAANSSIHPWQHTNAAAAVTACGTTAAHRTSRRRSSAKHAAAPGDAGSTAPSVLVLGGGVVGLTTAVRLLEAMPGLDLTLVAEKFGADTTSNGAAGVWQPYKLSDTPPDLVHRWGEATFDHLMSLVHSADAVAAGVFLCYGHSLFTAPEPDPVWKDITPGFSRMSAVELQQYNTAANSEADATNTSTSTSTSNIRRGSTGGANASGGTSTSGRDTRTPATTLTFVDGFSYNTVVCEGRLYMRWLLQRLKQLGGRVQQRRVRSVGELASEGWTVVVDCCGLEAPKLFEDQESYPIRGQVMRVRAPWVTQCVFGHVEEPHYNYYIIPNRDHVVLGGTGQYNEWNKEISLADAERIFAGCCRLVPSLKHAEVVEHWAGLRPGRTSVRLEAETIHLSGTSSTSGADSSSSGSGSSSGSSKDRELHVVHNYGHGGSGLTLAWGCAGDAVKLVQNALHQHQHT